ncbi:unnamed protein product [Adineta ricciae]|uniref:Uncharacterized protein n=1 Tax=Adineta ricciae TaxID=249248 RepID=A0A816D5Q6_ADIRI|nr:unnamed protein product [Adineta ricciae]CAF1633869.1 unnamed protein product [Adineta ricciae]
MFLSSEEIANREKHVTHTSIITTPWRALRHQHGPVLQARSFLKVLALPRTLSSSTSTTGSSFLAFWLPPQRQQVCSGDFTIDSSPVHSSSYSFYNGCSNGLIYLGQPFTAAIGTIYNVTFCLKNGPGSNDNTDVHVG